MSHDISRYDHYVATDSLIWGFSVEENNSSKDLSGATVTYTIVPNRGDADSEAILDESDSAVTVSVEPSSPEHPDAPSDTTGYVETTIDSGQLDRGGESLWQRVKIDDGSLGQKTFRGDFYVNEA